MWRSCRARRTSRLPTPPLTSPVWSNSSARCRRAGGAYIGLLIAGLCGDGKKQIIPFTVAGSGVFLTYRVLSYQNGGMQRLQRSRCDSHLLSAADSGNGVVLCL